MHIGAAKPGRLWPEPYEELDAQDRREMWEAYRTWYGLDASRAYAADHGITAEEADVLHCRSIQIDGPNQFPKEAPCTSALAPSSSS